jgi:hypothetical protein
MCAERTTENTALLLLRAFASVGMFTEPLPSNSYSGFQASCHITADDVHNANILIHHCHEPLGLIYLTELLHF